MSQLDVMLTRLQEIFSRLKKLETSTQSGVSRRQAQVLATSQSRSATSYGDMGTVGPSLSVDVPASGTVLLGVGAYIDPSADKAGMGFTLAGANVQAATDDFAAKIDGATSNVMMWFLLENLDPGVTTVTAKYKSFGGGAVFFSGRTLIALPI